MIRLALAIVAFLTASVSAQTGSSNLYRSVLRIEVATQNPGLRDPLEFRTLRRRHRHRLSDRKKPILTNAHVVSNQQRILVTVHGSPEKYPAKVEFHRTRLRSGAAFAGRFLRLRGFPDFPPRGNPASRIPGHRHRLPRWRRAPFRNQGNRFTHRFPAILPQPRGLPSRRADRCRHQSRKLGRPRASGWQGGRSRLPRPAPGG